MKKRFTFLAALFIAISIFGQSSEKTSVLEDNNQKMAPVPAAPEQISYQAVVRDATNATVANQVVGMKISILQDGTLENPGSAVYVETQTPTTNANGLLSIYIGGGTTVTGIFSQIDWSAVPYYIKIEIDPSGNNANYTITGTTQLVSVPYALYAKTAGSAKETQTLASVVALGNIAGAQIKNVIDPTDDQDAATKAYVDGSKKTGSSGYILAKIGDIKGFTEVSGKKTWHDVLTYSWGMSQNGTLHVGGGGGSGKASFQDIVITLDVNSSFAHFAKYVATGRDIVNIEFEFYSLDKGGEMLLTHTMTLSPCMLTALSFDFSRNDLGLPVGHLSINFGKVTMTFPDDEKGKFDWDISQNTEN
jgi:type VI protein secretion system component Hcp